MHSSSKVLPPPHADHRHSTPPPGQAPPLTTQEQMSVHQRQDRLTHIAGQQQLYPFTNVESGTHQQVPARTHGPPPTHRRSHTTGDMVRHSPTVTIVFRLHRVCVRVAFCVYDCRILWCVLQRYMDKYFCAPVGDVPHNMVSSSPSASYRFFAPCVISAYASSLCDCP